MIIKLLTEYHLEFLSLKGDCRGSSESTLVKISNCWKSHAAAHMCLPHVFLVGTSSEFQDILPYIGRPNPKLLMSSQSQHKTNPISHASYFQLKNRYIGIRIYHESVGGIDKSVLGLALRGLQSDGKRCPREAFFSIPYLYKL